METTSRLKSRRPPALRLSNYNNNNRVMISNKTRIDQLNTYFFQDMRRKGIQLVRPNCNNGGAYKRLLFLYSLNPRIIRKFKLTKKDLEEIKADAMFSSVVAGNHQQLRIRTN